LLRLGYAGVGLFLLGMGFKTYQNAPLIAPWKQSSSNVSSNGWVYPMFGGGFLSVSNPYWVAWWLTVGSGFMVTALSYGTAGNHSFYLGHILADYVWYLVVASLVGSGARFMNDWVYRIIVRGSSVILASLGFVFLVVGVGELGF
jgi:threonine/homoserine/homoserine lactone efflux protein